MPTYKAMCESIMKIDDFQVFADEAIELIKKHAKDLISFNRNERAIASEKAKAEAEAKAKAEAEVKTKEPTTHKTLVELWDKLAPGLLDAGGIVSGGFVSSFIKWDDKKIPGDMDIWLPNDSFFCPGDGWERSEAYHTGRNMPPNVSFIAEYTNPKYQIKIQVIQTKEKNPFSIIDNFDFDVCKGVMSPGLDQNGRVIGIRATRPEVYNAIMSNIATFLERPWDLEKDGMLNKKALNRWRKYTEKGYNLRTSEKSKFTSKDFESMIAADEELKKTKASETTSYGQEVIEGEYTYLYYAGKLFRYSYFSKFYKSYTKETEIRRAFRDLCNAYEERYKKNPLPEKKYWTLTQLGAENDKAIKLERKATYLSQVFM